MICGAKGILLYSHLRDSLYGVPGKWSFKRCSRNSCGLIWLDPFPVKKELPKLYTNYYTHKRYHTRNDVLFRRFYRKIQDGYLSLKYGYTCIKNDTLNRFLGILLYLYPSRRAEIDASIMNLPAKPGGKVLEIGFGEGSTLQRLSSLGWSVEGIDFDPIAVQNALSDGIRVHHGDVHDQGYEENKFDAVVSSHVIEHVDDPKQFIKECYRILKKNGLLILYTPNSLSFGHRLFRHYWGGIDPPRHLNIFNCSALLQILKIVNFQNIICKPSFQGSKALYLSFLLWRYGDDRSIGFFSNWLLLEIFRLIESIIAFVYPKSAEDLILIAKK